MAIILSHSHPVNDKDGHFVIDPITKEICPSTEKLVLAQHSHNSERFTFELPKEVEGHDMTKCNLVEIHYQNVAENGKDKNISIYKVTDLKEDGDTVTFSWLIDGRATHYVGGLIFAIHLSCTGADGVSVEYNFSTLAYSGVTVGETVWNSETIAKEYPELLAEFDARINRLERATGGEAVLYVNFVMEGEFDDEGFAMCVPDETQAAIWDAYTDGGAVKGILQPYGYIMDMVRGGGNPWFSVTISKELGDGNYIYDVLMEADDSATVQRTKVDSGAPGGNVTPEAGRFFGKVANFLGDSQTDDAGNYKSVFFYDWLKNILGLSATNSYGYSGTTIMPISGQNKSFLDRYTSMSDDADLIVVWGGTNDYHYGHPLGNVDDTANTTFCGALNNLCKGLIVKYPQKDILFVTPTPRGNIAGAVATQKEYADAIINVCAKYCIPVFDAFRKCNMPINYEYPRKHTVDGLHLNDLGHEVLGKSMANFILYSEMAGAQKAWGGSGGGGDDSGGGNDNGGSSETEVTLAGITATYSGGDVVVGTALNALTGLVVTATYSDGSTATVTGYTLSGSIGEGSNTITVSYGGMTTTFSVTGIAEVEEAPASPVDGKTVTFTAQASWPAASNLTLLVNIADFPSYVHTDALTVRATIADATKTISGFGAGMQIFTDETGQLNNGAFKTGISGYVSSTIEGNEIIATAIMEDTQPDYAYAKIAVPLSISEYPVSFKIVSLTAELNGTYIPIQAVGGFYGNEGYSES